MVYVLSQGDIMILAIMMLSAYAVGAIILIPVLIAENKQIKAIPGRKGA